MPTTRVSVIATPDAMVTPVTGFFELLDSLAAFEVEIVAESAGPIEGASGLSIAAHRAVSEVARTDVVIVPSMEPGDGDWVAGRYPRLVSWMRRMHAGGATVCAACTGALLVAETGLLDGHDVTVHWICESQFRRRHPEITLRMDEVLVVSGEGGRLVTSGVATAWHDMVLYLIARYAGPATAQDVARFQLMNWHRDGQAAFQVFDPPDDHGDAAILAAQRWLAEHHAVASPVDEMVRRSGLPQRTFKRRFKSATDCTPIAYVQRVRVERAKRLLETSSEPIEEISWAVGYEDPASFRRLFKRITGLTPGAYRQRFRLPDLPHVSSR
ncbi:MAG TPA: helix-turn-helix domain-containing protein [Thermoleophilaceae bacterium]|nr:helix-turn-helix domain-containing protein [Thermoleophilaceae bacterium]